MADETKSATTVPANKLTSEPAATVDKPLATLDQKEQAIVKSDPAPVVDPDPETPAADRIREFEDTYLGVGAVRIGGRIERGSGSPFAALSDERKRQYAALEKLGEAEQKLVAAHAALMQAEDEHIAAYEAAEPKPDAE